MAVTVTVQAAAPAVSVPIPNGATWTVDAQNRLVVSDAGNPGANPPVSPKIVAIFSQWIYAIAS